MDVDDLLGPARLPDVAVDTDDALARTVARGRTWHRRRRVLAAFGAVAVVAGVAVTAVSLAGDDPNQVETVPATTGPSGVTGTTAEPGTGSVPTEPAPGDEATWTIDPADPPSAGDSTFTALVMRIGCNGGETGQVLPPTALVSDTQVVVTFAVERMEGVATCPGNNEVPYEVDLGVPLGDRALVDGTCTAGGPNSDSGFCAEDGGVRWPLPTG
jgi:hypothetical protein